MCIGLNAAKKAVIILEGWGKRISSWTPAWAVQWHSEDLSHNQIKKDGEYSLKWRSWVQLPRLKNKIIIIIKRHVSTHVGFEVTQEITEHYYKQITGHHIASASRRASLTFPPNPLVSTHGCRDIDLVFQKFGRFGSVTQEMGSACPNIS